MGVITNNYVTGHVGESEKREAAEEASKMPQDVTEKIKQNKTKNTTEHNRLRTKVSGKDQESKQFLKQTKCCVCQALHQN